MNIKQAIQVGLLFGIPIGIFFMYTSRKVDGMVMGLVSGLFFGLILYLFANSKMVKNQTAVGSEYLLPGEKIILTEGANFIVKPKEFGLKNLLFDDLLWAVGMKNKEALGGMIHLTNYRLIFKSHNFNRLRGMVSIFLPTIKESRNTSFFITKKITIETYTSNIDFIVYEVDKLIDNIQNTKNLIDFSYSQISKDMFYQSQINAAILYGRGIL